MDAQPSPHPPAEALRAYGQGELDDASAEVVREHLEDCSDCRHQIAEMPPDSFVDRLREAHGESELTAFARPFAEGSQAERFRSAGGSVWTCTQKAYPGKIGSNFCCGD
jgi:predicted anti-sigma-YlaC factor YlaD